MITYIKITGFKSFHNFEMEFTPLTIIAGANASGKSNLFDALMLLARLAEMDSLKKAFSEQRGEFIELFTQYGGDNYAKNIEFEVEMLVNRHIKDAWGNEAKLKYTRLRYELKIKRFTNASGMEDLAVVHEKLVKLNHLDDKWIKIIPKKMLNHWRPQVDTGKRGTSYIETKTENGIPTIIVPQDGVGGNQRRFPLNHATRTVLSSFDTIDFPHVFAAKSEMRSWKYLQLNPDDLRQATSKRNGEDMLSSTGKNLAGILYRIKQADASDLVSISRKLNNFLPNFIEVDVIDDNENKQYLIKLKDIDKKEFSSRVLSEGTLRLLALCILEYDDNYTGLLCFEEPENGIHPFRIKDMAQLLKDLTIDFDGRDINMPLRQVIINTHSPVLVGNLYAWKDDKNVSIWFAQMRTLSTNIDNQRIKIQISKISPVIKDVEMALEFSEQEKKLSLSMVKEYLQTADLETINN